MLNSRLLIEAAVTLLAIAITLTLARSRVNT